MKSGRRANLKYAPGWCCCSSSCTAPGARASTDRKWPGI
ncbi:hypothetical protein C4K23_3675 [Pseudomonas chlororaphis]|nr:hypothetical protein C4K23_3675 [Pseudomonas chlororaphis]